MKTLLLNGRSFTECWTPSKYFLDNLNCDTYVNIGKVATSFQRTCWSTVEWIAQNGDPNFIIVPITFSHRWELALYEEEDTIDGAWTPLQISDLINEKHELHGTNFKDLKKLIDDYYKIIPTIKTYWDKQFTEIIMLAGWLASKNIPYLMFDMCNEFDMKHLKGYKGFSKLDIIKTNNKIINLFNFCGNRYMWSTMPNKDQIDFNIHHAPEQYIELEKYLLNYLKKISITAV